jgi:hypothetical protein
MIEAGAKGSMENKAVVQRPVDPTALSRRDHGKEEIGGSESIDFSSREGSRIG